MAKLKNKRCPFQKECEKSCEYINRELKCNYYKYNAVGDSIIPDQEEMRAMMNKVVENEINERELANLPEEEGEAVADEAKLVYIDVEELHEHPDNPRKNVGDVTELADSIRAKGVMQNLTVVRGHYENGSHEAVDGGYTVIIGHRRRAAAIEAGLEVLPCAIVDMDYRDQVSTMLLENMQRVDLTPYEQAQGFQMMMDLGDTVDGIAEKTGFSKKTVKHRLEMAKLDSKVLKDVSARQITIGEFEQLERVKNIKTRNKLLEKIGTYNFNGAVEAAVRQEEFAEWLPDIIDELKELGAKELADNERYSSKYEFLRTMPCSYVPSEDDPIVDEEYLNDELYYAINIYSYNVGCYRKKPKEEKEKRSAEEILRERDISDRISILKNMTEMAYILRFNFAKSFTMNASDREKVMLGAISALSVFTFNTLYSRSAKEFLEYVGEETSNKWQENVDAAYAFLKKYPSRSFPALVYISFNDSVANGYYQTQYNDYPVHKENPALDSLYDWLISLGYEMSDDERRLRRGTHEVFKVENA